MTPPRVVVVAQPFKETLTAAEVAGALEAGVRRAGGAPAVVIGSDGGDGLLEALSAEIVNRTTYRVEDPLLRPVEVTVAWLDAGTAVIESRLACGLSLLNPAERDPRVTSTRGVGSLIGCAVADGAQRVIVGLGGSATMDGGVGMARAWGWIPRAVDGSPLAEGGGALTELRALDSGDRPPAELIGLADVASPLIGPRGAWVFARQKGASDETMKALDAGLERLVEVAGASGRELASRPGSGAAGGLGFGLLHFGAGSLVPGAAWVLERCGFVQALNGASLLVVGEGAFDRTSSEGKLSGVALSRARDAGVPALLLAPSATDVPRGVEVETGGGFWDAGALEEHTVQGVTRALRLLAQ